MGGNQAVLPNKPRGIPHVDDRRVLHGIFWVLRSGAPWRDLPVSYGPRTTCPPARRVAAYCPLGPHPANTASISFRALNAVWPVSIATSCQVSNWSFVTGRNSFS